mmetsp:Transcript_72997/g.176450  ORF Transcript_72997/g.176450 Transcript_72997/m.176450 type:complete len:442 (+) Transcript_72997:8-1333(+)
MNTTATAVALSTPHPSSPAASLHFSRRRTMLGPPLHHTAMCEGRRLAVASLVPELRLDGGVVRVGLAEACWVLLLQRLPHVVGHELVARLARVEAVDLGDQVHGVAAVRDVVLDEGLPAQVLEDEVEVRPARAERRVVHDLRVLGVERLRPRGGGVAQRGVHVEPARARVRLVAVQVGVHPRVRDAQRVDLRVHDVPQHAPVHQRDEDDGRVVRQHSVQVVQGRDDVGVELRRGRHVAQGVRQVAVAHVVADQREHHDGGAVLLLVAPEGGDDAAAVAVRLHGARARAVHADVGKVAVDAAVVLAHALVEGAHGQRRRQAGRRVHVARRPGALRPVRLVLGHGHEVLERPLLVAQVAGRDVEVRRGRVAQDRDAAAVGALAPLLLVALARVRVDAGDAVAVVVHVRVLAGQVAAAAGVHVRVGVVAVTPAPVSAAEAAVAA